jgi:Fe2+ transport system protein B
MTETTNKIIKIVLVVITLIGLSGIILACGTSSKTSEAQATVKELIELKTEKQQCKDSLNYQETIEEYKGIYHCNQNDERIVELKKTLQENLLNDYEQVDSIIMHKQLENIASSTGNKAEQLLGLMLSE